MQDVQNIPNPDVNIIEDDGDFGSHSDRDAPDTDIEQPDNTNRQPNDRAPNVPIEEPPNEDDDIEQIA